MNNPREQPHAREDNVGHPYAERLVCPSPAGTWWCRLPSRASTNAGNEPAKVHGFAPGREEAIIIENMLKGVQDTLSYERYDGTTTDENVYALIVEAASISSTTKANEFTREIPTECRRCLPSRPASSPYTSGHFRAPTQGGMLAMAHLAPLKYICIGISPYKNRILPPFASAISYSPSTYSGTTPSVQILGHAMSTAAGVMYARLRSTIGPEMLDSNRYLSKFAMMLRRSVMGIAFANNCPMFTEWMGYMTTLGSSLLGSSLLGKAAYPRTPSPLPTHSQDLPTMVMLRRTKNSTVRKRRNKSPYQTGRQGRALPFGRSSEEDALSPQLPQLQQPRDDRFRTPIQRQQTTDDLNRLYTSLGTNLLDTYPPKTQSSKSSRSTSVQPKASQSAPLEVKAGGSKEVPIALESDVEEINPLREGETKLGSFPSSSDSSGGPSKKKRDRRSAPSSSGSGSSSLDSSSESGVRRREKKDSKKSSGGDDSKLRWKRFDFSLDKENHLAGWANWELWSNALNLAMEKIGYKDGIKLGQLDQLRLAKTITKTCKRAPLKLITGIKKGTKMLRTLRRTYAATGKSRQRSLWKEFSKVTYDGGDPVQFTTKFQKLLRKVKGCGMQLGTKEQITMFLTAMEDRAGCCKFYDRSNKKKNNNNGRSHNARKGKGNRNNNGKPAWNKDGEPLCFNCGKYGHMAKDCPEPLKEKNGKGKKGKRGQNGGQRQGSNNGNSSQSNRSNSSRDTRGGGQSEEQFIPEGLRDLYRSTGQIFSAHVEERQLQDLMRYPERPELQATESPKLQGTDCPELWLQATESPELQAAECPEVTEIDYFDSPEPQVTERAKPQMADCPEATKATVVGSAMLLHVHSSMGDDRDKLLWDSGANVNITNNIGDFEKNSVLDIRAQGIHIMTGEGPVVATSVGTVKWPLMGPGGERNNVTGRYTLQIDDFPLKVFSGEVPVQYNGDRRVNFMSVNN
ncbi:hypothetical protein DL771_009401 [Monosporascus sp. 5C6A]|nr:hypothetical protein DL771_009401 [Monosporascus sp. 5C6A]